MTNLSRRTFFKLSVAAGVMLAMPEAVAEAAGPLPAMGFEGGWLLCDGGSLPIAEYPELFAVIGRSYGSKDGKTFQVPDFTNEVKMKKLVAISPLPDGVNIFSYFIKAVPVDATFLVGTIMPARMPSDE